MIPRNRVPAPPDRNRLRRPTPAEMGEVVTVAIVALTAPHAYFVSASDQMISHDDILPADEGAMIKELQIARNWSVAFAGNKIENVFPLIDRVTHKIGPKIDGNLEASKLQNYFTTSIAEMTQADFFNRRIARYGYRDLEAFLQHGKDQLDDIFFELCRELNEADLGVEFIVYGYESGAHDPRIFEVNGKGEIVDRMPFRYAVIGSGYMMASASLKRNPYASIDFDSMMYRVLEAKFSAETASGVGKRWTTVKVKRPNQHDFRMLDDQIAKIRAVWEAGLFQPQPKEACELIGIIRKQMMHDDRMRSEYFQQAEQKKSAGGP
jgi:hypothetical protein